MNVNNLELRKEMTNTKKRSIVAGPIRNSEKTKQKLIDAVGIILNEKGYQHITARNITEVTGLNRKLINHYFGNLENLINIYLNSTDYWTKNISPKLETIVTNNEQFGQAAIGEILATLFDEVHNSANLRGLLNWETSTYNDSLRKLADKREELGSALFKLTDEDFKDSDINLRAVLAIQIAGIYYLNLHAKTNGNSFCEIDINDPKGADTIKQALQTIIELVYKNK